jgi:O-acetylhomoserine (thiol)-lyase
MSAIFYAIANVAESGDNIVVAKQVYGGTTTLTSHTIKRFGIEARYFDIENPKEIESLSDEKTKLILFESITNPSIDLADFEKIVDIANRLNILTCVDNTVATPILCKPLNFGCDLVVHSSSKYTTGQGLAIGGIIVEGKSAKSKIIDNSRYSHFNEPDISYHGLIYTKASDTPFSLRARLALLRDLGATPSPFNTWLYIQGIETLPLRMIQHSKSALEIAKFLENHPKVKRVNYAGLKSNKNYHLAQKYFPKGQSGLLSFELSSLEEAKKVADSTKIFKLVVNIQQDKA